MKVNALRIFLGVFVATVIFFSGARAQQPAGGGIQEKLAMVKQSAAANQQALHHYSWVETTQISLKGEVKSVKQSTCEYGADGKVVKNPMTAPEPPQPSGGRRGRVKEKMVEKKTDEMSQYMEQVKQLIGQYVPPDPNQMQQAFQKGNVSLNPSPGMISLAFKNYVVPGDSMTLSINETTKKIANLNVNSYLGQAKDVVTLSVMFGTLPDGTTYPNQVVVVAQAKQIQILTTNSDYQKYLE